MFIQCDICQRSYHYLNEKNGHGPVCGQGKSKAALKMASEGKVLTKQEVEDLKLRRKQEALIHQGKSPYFRLDASLDLTDSSFKVLDHVMSEYTVDQDFVTNFDKLGAIIKNKCPQDIKKTLEELSDWDYIEFETTNKGTVIKPKVYPQTKGVIKSSDKIEVLTNKTGSSFWVHPAKLAGLNNHSRKVLNAVLEKRVKEESDTFHLSLSDIKKSLEKRLFRSGKNSITEGLKALDEAGIIKTNKTSKGTEITTVGITVAQKN